MSDLTAVDIMKYFAVYEMTQNKRRVAYIFKNKPFPKDVENIRNALKVLGFNETDIKVHTFEEMPMVSKEFNDDDIDCIFCVILKNVELDNEFTDVAEVHNLLSYLKTDKCPLLAGIPKLIFVEASRGSKPDTAETQPNVNENEELISKCQIEEDTLIYFSSCLGYPSFNNESNGSWFISTLSKILVKYGTIYEMMVLLTGVSKHVASFVFKSETLPEFSKCKQMPCIMSKLTKQLKF